MKTTPGREQRSLYSPNAIALGKWKFMVTEKLPIEDEQKPVAKFVHEADARGYLKAKAKMDPKRDFRLIQLPDKREPGSRLKDITPKEDRQ